jgi:signal transduction histidine kinase
MEKVFIWRGADPPPIVERLPVPRQDRHMSLRARLIALFCALAVGPLAAIGVFDYFRANRAVRDLVASQVGAIAERTAGELRDRYALRESDLLLLAENAETQRLLRALEGGSGVDADAAHAAAVAYLRRAWESFAHSYVEVELRDAQGASAYHLGAVGEGTSPLGAGATPGSEILVVRRPIRDTRDGHPLGTLIAAIRLGALLPREALETRFGHAGYTAVLDRTGDRVVYHPLHAFARRAVSSLVGPDGWDVESAIVARERGSFVYREHDSTRVASFVSLAQPAWTVVTSAAVDEFAAPFARTTFVNLLLVLAITLLASAAFVLWTRRSTRSLEALTAAADEVGAGNFAPRLPPAGQDEVGRLSSAFALMVAKVRAMLVEVESSRHMAAVGSFASRLSHEIRNPLTSLKLNLQSLGRDAQAGELPASAATPLGICLREIERLDRVVTGALRLGRNRPLGRVPCEVHRILEDALDLVRAQLEQQHVRLETSLGATRDRIQGDPEGLKAVLLNVLLNAAEAMPAGGTLSVSTESVALPPAARPGVRVRVADSGVGIPAGARERIFEPFYSTKPHGTGFGLPVALRTVEEHGGQLHLADDDGRPGAAFLIDLPLSAQEPSP